MLRLLLVYIIIFSACIQCTAQVKETVLKDNFATNSAGWPEDNTTDFASKVENGNYHLVHTKSFGSKCFDIPIKMNLGENYFIETQGKLLSGDKHNGYGIVWGKGRGGYFTFVSTADGRFYVRKVHTGKQGSYLLGPTSSKFIRQGGQTNKLRVQYANDELMFFINDRYVGHLPNEKYFGNNAGLVLYGQQTVNIDYFGAYGTKNYERMANYGAKMSVSYYEIEDGHDDVGNYMGNGNCCVNPDETILLNVTLKNNGFARCNNVKATFYAICDYVTILDQDKPQYLNNVDRYQSEVITLKFKVSKACNIDKLNFKIDITDNNGHLGETIPMSVPLNTKIPPINKDQQGKVSFTFNVKETNSDDINSFYPITLQHSTNICAVIIGIESYQNLPKAKYAANDARIFYNYLVKVANVPRANIIYVTNQNATRARLYNILKEGGEIYAKENRDKVILYFSGMGLCENGKTDPYIMAFDSREDDPKGTGISVNAILKSIRNSGARQTMCFFETSFSGVDRDNRSFGNRGGTLWANAAFPVITDENTCMMYASGGQQCNPVMEKSSHGMFTHYLLTAMQQYGKNSQTLNMKVLYDYIYQNMDHAAMQMGINVFPRMDCINKDGIKLLK